MSSLAYRDDLPTETLDGEVFAMSPRPTVNHNVVAGNIYHIFRSFLEGKPCSPFSDGIDVYLTENDRVVPDIMIVCSKDIIRKDGIYGAPDLIVEVLSPSTAKRDKGYKKDLYERCGVKEYWMVDTDSRSIEVYLQKENKYVLDEIYSIYPDYLIAKMTEEEKNNIIYEFKTSLYPDMSIVVEKVFAGMF